MALKADCFAAALFLWGNALASEIVGAVVRVADGDTIIIATQGTFVRVRVRLSAIDAPEKDQAFGRRATTYLRDQVEGRIVTVHIKKEDRYGRAVGQVFFQGKDIGLSLLDAGMAWHYKKYSGDQSLLDRGRYSKAESSASANRLGLWAEGSPIPPWDFRRDKKQSARFLIH